MPKPFDAATKHLIEADPVVWLRFLGLPGEHADLLETDLTTVVADADRILSVTSPDYLAHIELQSTYKTDMDDRVFFYNAVAYYKFRKTVESVVVLLRKEAGGPAVSGRLRYGSTSFDYRIVRIWEKSPEELLSASLALLPLAPLSSVSETDLPGLVQRMEVRIDAEAAPEDRDMLWTTTYLLMGLKYTPEFSEKLLQGVRNMKESSTYQFILQEGREEEGRRMLIRLGTKRLGDPDPKILSRLEGITSLQQLEELADRLLEVETWQELLG